MRIAFLCKRRYMGKDVILDRYARLYELPRGLAARGHDVLGLCLEYAGRERGEWSHEAPPGQLSWHSWPAGRLLLPGIAAHARAALRSLGGFRPDVVLSASDVWHVTLGDWLARRLAVPHVVDLYDNYASFGAARLPGLSAAYARALGRAAGVSCVSAPLATLIRERHAPRGTVVTIESTVGAGQFTPRDREACRRELGLPHGVPLIGYAGALDRSRGIEDLYAAFAEVRAAHPDARLLLAGPVGRPALPRLAGLEYLGALPHAAVSTFYGALDVGVICVRDTPFGRYSFPQKAYEMLAMRMPLVVARVGAMASLFADHPACTYEADSSTSLAAALLAQLRAPCIPALPIPTWDEQAARLEALLVAAAH
ncbi:MAG: glycosyltransferase [Gammaproteobacteria bacterium]